VLLLPVSLLSWVDDGAMVLFFLVVGLELSREIAHGELADLRSALLPVVAAAGGMGGAALAYLAVAHSGTAERGVGIPTATDVAFALGTLALLGRLVPPALRVFVLALAVADDLGSLGVLVVGYSRDVDVARVACAAGCVVMMAGLRRGRVGHLLPYLALTLVCWDALVGSGIEPALAGVALGLSLPAASPDPTALERRTSAWTDPVVLPLFALSNAGVALGTGVLAGAGAQHVVIALLVARTAGKCVGIVVATVLAARIMGARLPDGVGVLHLVGAGLVCGVGFTVPLLVAGRAFAAEPHLLGAARLGLLAGSVLAAGAGAAVLLVASKWAPRHR
jgi:NhaA family Na+:H+ antiporter